MATCNLEPTAEAQYYIVYTRRSRTVNGQTIAGDWNNGTRVNTTHYGFVAERGIRYDFRIVAGNKGGVSLPSETHCAYLAPKPKGSVLIVNNFTRLAAPTFFADSIYAGIIPQSYAVQDGKDISFLGEQYDYLRTSEWQSDDNCGWGASYADQQFTLTAGNTHDYPIMHGKVLSELGYSYCSCSSAMILDSASLRKYTIVDVICGKEKENVFAEALRKALLDYTHNGGSLLLSGMYIGSEAVALQDTAFIHQVLRYSYRGDHASRKGTLLLNRSGWPMQIVRLISQPNADIICCENPQGLMPTYGASSIGTYTDSGMYAGIAYNGAYKMVALPFIMESAEDFPALFRNCIYYLSK